MGLDLSLKECQAACLSHLSQDRASEVLPAGFEEGPVLDAVARSGQASVRVLGSTHLDSGQDLSQTDWAVSFSHWPLPFGTSFPLCEGW